MDADQAEPPTAPPGAPATAAISLAARCAPVRLLVLDVDGVLTDGRIIHGDDGVEIRAFHVRDGSGLRAWLGCGKEVAWLSGRSSRAVELRAAELGIRHVYQGLADKSPVLRRLLAAGGWKAEEVCCVGDDLPDMPLLAACGLAVAVADACAEVRAAAHLVTRTRGGRGAVREAVELILRCQGLWPKVVADFSRRPG
jgi:3-deoxy-D-manno-octulosonate 8-phosphate phosphatase (KDO 8-P phosphatase)